MSKDVREKNIKTYIFLEGGKRNIFELADDFIFEQFFRQCRGQIVSRIDMT
jgi:hypothetical protein